MLCSPKVKISCSLSDTLLITLSQLINLFLINGFAFKGDVTIVSPGKQSNSAFGTEFCITMTLPANLVSFRQIIPIIHCGWQQVLTLFVLTSRLVVGQSPSASKGNSFKRFRTKDGKRTTSPSWVYSIKVYFEV